MATFDNIRCLDAVLRNSRYPVSKHDLCLTMECSLSTVTRTIRMMRNLLQAPICNRAAKTPVVGLMAKTGRYGRTFAQKGMAFECAFWVSVEFKLYLIHAFQRLQEVGQATFSRDIRRNLADQPESKYGRQFSCRTGLFISPDLNYSLAT